MSLFLNLCSGQRPFGDGWVNVDSQSRWNPNIVADCSSMPMFKDGSAEMIVIHHGLEHFGCGEANSMLKECWRILQPGGSLIITVPDMRQLALAWLSGKLSDQIYMTCVYGAFMGDPADRHAWGFIGTTLAQTLHGIGHWSEVKTFDWRPIPGTDIARAFWILGVEAVK